MATINIGAHSAETLQLARENRRYFHDFIASVREKARAIENPDANKEQIKSTENTINQNR